MLPALVSDHWFKENLENLLSKKLHTPVQIEQIQWQWETGIKIYGLCINDDPGFSDKPLLFIDKFWLDIGLADLLEKKINLNILTEQTHLNLVRDKQGYSNLEDLISRLPGSQEKNQEKTRDKKSGEVKLPFEIKADICFNNVFLYAEDQLLQKKLALKHSRFHLDVPSLLSEPFLLNISSSPELNDLEIQRISLEIFIKNLFNPEKKLNLKGVYARLKSSLPGTSVNITANPDLNETRINISSDLKELSSSLFMFLPQPFSSAKTRGSIDLAVITGAELTGALPFDISLKGSSLHFSGGHLKDKSVVPESFSINTDGDFNFISGSLRINQSSIKLLKNSSFFCKGDINLLSLDKKADLTAEHINLDLGEIADKFADFIPETFDLKNTSPKLNIKTVNYSGNISPYRGEITIKEVLLNIPFISNHDVSLSNLSLGFPEIKAFISKEENAVFGITAKAGITQFLNISKIEADKLAYIENFKQSLTLNCELPLKDRSLINVSNINLSAPFVRIEDKKHGPIKTGIKIDGKIDLLQINSPEKIEPGKIDIDGLQVDLNADNLLDLHLNLSAKDAGTKFLNTKGTADINLSNIPENIVSRIPVKIKTKGKAGLAWDFTGRIPDKKEIENLMSSASFKMEKDLAFINKTDLSFAVKKGWLEIPFSKKQVLRIKDISTLKPFSYSFNQKNRKGNLSGSIVLNKIEKIPYVPVKNPLNIDISLSGSHDDFYSFTLSQDLNINPAQIKESWTVSLYGMDHVLKRGYKKPSALWLSHLGGKSKVSIKMKNMDELKIFKGFPDINGNMELNTDFKLIPGKSIDTKIRMRSSKTNVQWKDLLYIKNLNADIQLARLYELVKQGSQKYKEIQKPLFLSSQVLKTDPLSVIEKNTLFQSFTSRLKSRFDKKHSLSLDMLKLESGGLPLKTGRIAADMNLNQGLYGIEFFQAEIFGGTVMGSFSVFENKKRFYSQCRIGFSSLDAEKILPEIQNMNSSPDTELGGQVKFLIPLSTAMSSLIQELEFEIYFSHIGSRFLERTLYAIDPYESNESIADIRKILKTGSPVWIKIRVSKGSFSLDGEVEAKGIRIAIPSLSRINISSLSGIEKYEKFLYSLKPVIRALEISSKNIMIINKNGSLTIGDY